MIGGVSLSTLVAQALEYTPIPQSQLSLVSASSQQLTGEPAPSGPSAAILDGNNATYWHSQYSSLVPAPHVLTFKVADAPVRLGRVRLLPRQNSGSGLINEYELRTASGDCTVDAGYTVAKSGALPFTDRTAERVIALDAPVMANCVRVVYKSSWGGDGSVQATATLADFNADTATGDVDPVDPTDPPTGVVVVVPAGAVELVDGDLKVRLHPGFPQVVDYRLGTQQMAGRLGNALTSVLINEVQQAVTVTAPVRAADGKSATYSLTFPGLPGVSMDAVASVADGAFTLTFTNLVDPNNDVNRLRIPNHNLVTVGSADSASQLTAGMLNVDRTVNGDRFENVAATSAGGVQGSWMVMANNSTLAAAFDSNSTDDNTATAAAAARVQGSNNRWQRQIVADGSTKLGSVWAGTWTWLGEAVETYEGSLGRDADPYLTVKITGDANDDGQVDWQDAGIAARDIVAPSNGMGDVKNDVISRIPFNIVSQATHPFLRTLDDTKRISLATDNLGQKALLKGYEAEGHDSAHPDYAGHYNERAGGLAELKILADEGVNYNTHYGVHVNATESYSEAKAFSEDLLRMPPQKAWGWMNQSYYINGPKDLATKNVLQRFQDFWDERPANLDWLYMDVYYPSGWEGERLSDALEEQGWVIGSEWSNKFPEHNIWSHWSQDEPYGGQTNKGIQSNVIRFVENSRRDTWNPHPILSNSNVVDFEGWSGKVDYNSFIKNIWARNLPVKFLQQSDIVKWEPTQITFKNGTVASSTVASIPGTVVPTDRSFVYDGATVYQGGSYLLPWKDGGEDRLYHYNTTTAASEWTLTNSWKGQGTLELFKLTDTGRVKISDIIPVNGKITIPGAEVGVAYVLYPTSKVPAAKAPNWGQGSHINDPSFFSGTLDAYQKTGDVKIVKSARANSEVEMGAGPASISQELNLSAGTYSAWAWIMVDRGKTRPVTVEASGVTKAGYSTFADGKASNTITASTVENATASDEKRATNYQRVRVTFTSTGAPVTLTVRAGDGDAKVWVEDLRVVKWKAPADADAPAGTIYFQDFENVDVGYYPFVTGYTNRGGDARTQLAEKHAPYSQKGWWGVSLDDKVVEGGKLNDNVLDGTWSLMANNENTGEILKTAPGAINFEAGRKYLVSFDYQTTFADQYRVRLGHDVLNASGSTAVSTVSDVLGEKRTTTRWSKEFNASECGVPFIAIDKLQGPNTQHNMTIDNMRVQDIGAADSGACIAGGMEAPAAVSAGDDFTVTTTVTGYNDGITNVTHALDLPAGWTSKVATAGKSTLAFGESSVQTWTVTNPTNAEDSTIGFTGTATVAGKVSTVTGQAFVRVIAPLPGGEIYLSDMQERVTSATVGYGTLQWDKSSGGGPLKLRGETYPKGIGAHAISKIDFDLKAECTVFQATVGVDDVQATRGSVSFAVHGDNNTLLAQSPVLKGNGATYVFNVDITGVTSLSLRAGDGGDGNGNDHADWAAARVTCGNEEPPALDPKVSATPAVVEPGEVVTVALTGFAPKTDGGDVEVRIGDELVATADIDADGNGTATVTVPADAADGTLTMSVSQPGADVEAIAVSVTVKKAVDPSPEPTVTPTVKPTVTPTVKPTVTPTVKPTVTPTVKPSVKPTLTPSVKPTFKPEDVYTTPGYHTVNGRQWFTRCEPYSVTFRCWTSIWSTQVTHEGGRFVSKTGWFHNNLTYLPSPRSSWTSNPLGRTNNWTASDGRQWYTECDTATTGRNGCRSYLYVSGVVESSPKAGGGYSYTLVNKWVFNNIVLFT
ncbi:hypothetical protein EAX62_05205 [Tessaracoccus antarcticus]|uniref:Glycosyl hydrolase family 98 putative carbohydrate-binding module domain-containing protein n=2 Tax=Tessaracoccus antarcticus TaxID=2479848 RepID=A0A3M0GC22_9ACTN|nr:hypothetical protein EAX62_05205 [Tessaracoccus antarcticus]